MVFDSHVFQVKYRYKNLAKCHLSLSTFNRLASPNMPDVLPQLLPVMKATNIEARSVTISWTYSNRDPRYLFPDLTYQLSRAEIETMVFEIVTDGLLMNLVVEMCTSFVMKLTMDMTSLLASLTPKLKEWKSILICASVKAS